MKKIALLSVFLLMTLLIWAQPINVPADQPSIQAAIEAAVEGDTVLVEEGTYFENINFLGKAITVASRFILDGDESHISNTIIDGSKPAKPDTASVVIMWSGEDTTSVLSGFTITGGSGSLEFEQYHGAGISLIHSGGKICNNIIENNEFGDADNFPAGVGGGGISMMVDMSHWAILRDNIIRNNIARGIDVWGGAVILNGGGITVENNSILNNKNIADPSGNQNWGAGIAFHNSFVEGANEEVIIRGNTISGNTGESEGGKGSGGGGIFGHGNFQTLKIDIYNNLISENVAYIGGGIMFLSDDPQPSYELNVFNNTIINNEATGDINSVDMTGIVFLKMYNNIIWSNVDNGKEEFYVSKGLLELCHNILEKPVIANEGTVPLAAGNTYLEPLFENDTYMSAANSPAVGRGVDSVLIGKTWHYAPEYDILGNPRPDAVDKYMDLGAYESEFSPVLYSFADVFDIRHMEYTIRPLFHSDTLRYSVEVLDTCTALSDFLVSTMDGLANINIDPATDIVSENVDDRTTTIMVTSSDGSAESVVYQVEFMAISTDATLKELTVEGYDLVPAFSPEIMNYEVLLRKGTTEAPAVTAVTNNESTLTSIYNASLEDTSNVNSMKTKIIVKPEAGPKYNQTYEIVFKIDTDYPVEIFESVNNGNLKLYPNPFNSTATLEFSDQLAVERIMLVNILGEAVRTIDRDQGNNVTIERGDLPAGLYFLQVQSDELYVIKVLIE